MADEEFLRSIGDIPAIESAADDRQNRKGENEHARPSNVISMQPKNVRG
jgi:hypothetical protein